MKRVIYILLFLLVSQLSFSQTFKFYYSNTPKFLKSNNDTMQYPFVGGMNMPQFSNVDLNNDGIKDLVVFDRSMYSVGHKLLTFVWKDNAFYYDPQYESRFPEMTDWVKMLDENSDGKEEIFTNICREQYQLVDTSYIPQVNGLRIFKNLSDSLGVKFKLIYDQVYDTGRYFWAGPGGSYPPAQVGITANDMTAIEDIDGDGDNDIIGFQSSALSITPFYYENFTKNDQGIHYGHDSVVFVYRDDCWGFVSFDVFAGTNRFKLHQPKNAGCFTLYNKQQKHAGTTMTMIDLNGDGVKDLIYGDIGFTNLVSLTNSRKKNSKVYVDSIVSQDTLFPSNTVPFNFIMQPAVYYADINNDNKKDLLVSTNNPTGVKNANNVWVYTNSGTTAHPIFNYQGNNLMINNESIDLGARTTPVLIDIDNDGDKDLIVATNGDYAQTQNNNDRLVLYKNISADPLKPVFTLSDTNFLMLSTPTPIINLHPTFGDLNGDGKEDLIIGDASGNLRYYTNQTSGTNYSFLLQSSTFSNIQVKGYAAPQLVDLNKDGKLDLVIGNRLGFIQYFQNTGTTAVPQFSNVPTIDTLGKVKVNKVTLMAQGYSDTGQTAYATPIVCDLDNDGNYEMLVGCQAGYLYLYTGVNTTPGTVFSRSTLLYINDGYTFVSDNSSLNTYKLNFGGRTSPFVGDLDGDSKPDIIMGNIRGGLNYFGSNKKSYISVGPSLQKVNPNIVLYPNPANETIHIATENMNENIRYEVYDEIGKLTDKGEITKYHSDKAIDISDYQIGFYFIVFKGESGFSVAKRFMISK